MYGNTTSILYYFLRFKIVLVHACPCDIYVWVPGEVISGHKSPRVIVTVDR